MDVCVAVTGIVTQLQAAVFDLLEFDVLDQFPAATTVVNGMLTPSHVPENLCA